MVGLALPNTPVYLDKSIAEEGEKVMFMDSGDGVSFIPPPPKPIIPDMSNIKSIRKYFGRIDGPHTYPAWFYHPTEPAFIIKNSREAAHHGIVFREATNEEMAKYGRQRVWDFAEGCLWRPYPYPGTQKFDPKNPGQGKIYEVAKVDTFEAQNRLMEVMLPKIVEAMRGGGPVAPTAPANIDPQQWEAFNQFLAWQKASQVVDAVAKGSEMDLPPLPAKNPIALDEPIEIENLVADSEESERDSPSLTEEQEWAIWSDAAKQKGIIVDGRWSLDNLRKKVNDAGKS